MYGIRTYIYVISFLLYSLFPLRKLKRLRAEGKMPEARAWQKHICEDFGRKCFEVTGSHVKVYGQENVPKDRACVFVSNHQGIFDIHAMLGYTGVPIGLVSKMENKKIPIVGAWMVALDCVFLERGNPRSSILQIAKAVELVKSGLSMVIFPEGTRAKCDNLGEFKQGSLKLATRSKAPIVPVTINGTYKIFEEHNKKIHPAEVTVTFGAPIETEGLTKEDEAGLLDQVVSVIQKNLDKRKSEY